MTGETGRFSAFALCFAAVLLCTAERARAHSWYEVTCCSERDCLPVDDGVVVERADGVHVQGHGTLSRTDPRLRMSRDDRDHLCVSQHAATKLLCVYRKPNGM